MLFHLIDDAYAIVCSGGVYKQTKVYQRNGYLYAAWGTGFIGLFARGTTKPNVSFIEICGMKVTADKMGRLQTDKVEEEKVK